MNVNRRTFMLLFFILQSTSVIFAFSKNVDGHSLVKVIGTALAEEAYPLSIVPAEDDPDFSEEKQIIPPLPHPKWFKDSLLDLPADLAEAKAANKGLILYFGQRVCTYCDVLLNDTLGKPDIVKYTQKYFDVIAFDVEGKLVVTTLNGTRETESAFAQIEKTHFTPSLIFYDNTGKEALRLRGYQSPHDFRAALDYVVSGAFNRLSFKDYLAQTQSLGRVEALNAYLSFEEPPYTLNRVHSKNRQILAIFFWQEQCHACDLFHIELLKKTKLLKTLQMMNNVQLDIESNILIVTPQGQRLTAKTWAEQLGLFFTPTILFFNEQGQEIVRVSSIVELFQLEQILQRYKLLR